MEASLFSWHYQFALSPAYFQFSHSSFNFDAMLFATCNEGRGECASCPDGKENNGHMYYDRRHHAIVVPFRNREQHLERFIAYMGPYLKRNFPQDGFSLYIMEQADEKLFNRGFLLNAGLTRVYERMRATQCVILHDIDLVPKYKNVPYTNCTKPIQLGSELQHHNWSYPYAKNTGGVISMHIVDWQTINGMSNDYEGWGVEDDDLYQRLLRNDLLRNPERSHPFIPEIVRPPLGKGVFVHLEDVTSNTTAATVMANNNQGQRMDRKKAWDNPKRNENKRLHLEMMKKSDRWKHDGLSDIDFDVLSDEIDQDTKGADAFFEVHRIKVLAQVNYLQQPEEQKNVI